MVLSSTGSSRADNKFVLPTRESDFSLTYYPKKNAAMMADGWTSIPSGCRICPIAWFSFRLATLASHIDFLVIFSLHDDDVHGLLHSIIVIVTFARAVVFAFMLPFMASEM